MSARSLETERQLPEVELSQDHGRQAAQERLDWRRRKRTRREFIIYLINLREIQAGWWSGPS